MNSLGGVEGPFPFRRSDLTGARLLAGVRHTLADFGRWREAHPRRIAEHIDQHTAHLAAERRDRLARLHPRRRAERARIRRDVVHFAVFDLAELVQPATLEAMVDAVQAHRLAPPGLAARIDGGRGVAGVVESLARHLPPLRDLPELRWLTERLTRLHRALPESVVRSGSMGKVVRAMAGVLAIGGYATFQSDRVEARAHLARILPAAYAYGASYAIVDDTLHDLAEAHLPAAERDRYHRLIVRGLTTGEPVALAQIPDHPLAEELHDLQGRLRESYPFQTYRHLYHAAEAMYLAQHRDAARGSADPPPALLTAMYPDLFVKAGMSRVIANLLAHRQLDDGFYARCVNTIFLSQLRDDLVDRADDRRAGRLTPFTCPAEQADTNPLYDLFAYHAYAADEVFGGDPDATDALTHRTATRLARHLAGNVGYADELIRDYRAIPELARFLRTAAGLPGRIVRRLDDAEQRVKREVGRAFRDRDPATVDCRTFVADRLPYLNDVIRRHQPVAGGGELGAIVAYALAGSGKRLRPALSLMLAQGLGVDPATIEPALAAGELFHTASLIFDDLPAQDDATVRRGRPAAHLVFDEGSVQLAALSMISAGFGLLAQLDRWYPAARVTEVIAYAGSALGPDRLCQGQALDLRLGRTGGQVSLAEILDMYDLKTSSALEASLVPLALVLDRPEGEISLLKRYAHHAGIVFQIRDDILDATASTETLGKDAGHDTGKVNVVRLHGLAEAERILRSQVADAVRCCERLPFDTDLLACAVTHFATRRR